ncbi:MAG: hypothetical protein GAK43_00179 [Stenotrophomonas maltophilia]|nr:MAG: hypothetical protein GAK43_00179 [Stenotrophomonas maltophilia]
MAEALADLQRRWAGHVRDPSRPAPAGIDARRLAIYRRLCIDSLDGLLAGSLPRLQHHLGPTAWRAMVEHYYAQHACQTPLFPQIAAEFAAWLGQQETVMLPPWAAELAHLESSQQALRIEPRDVPTRHVAALVPATQLALSLQVRVLGYRWPVHDDVALETLPALPSLLLLRLQPDGELQLDALAPLAYALLMAFGEQGARVADAVHAVALEHAAAEGELLLAAAPLLDALCAASVLVAPTPA